MLADFEIRVNGVKFMNWISASVGRSIDNLCGSFSFTTSTQLNFPIGANDLVQIYVNDTLKLTGYPDTFNGGKSKYGHDITISGRDITQDIVDSNVPAEAANLEGGTLKELIESVINGLGITNIKVIEQVEEEIAPFETFLNEDEIEQSAIDQKAFDFLRSFAHKRQVYLITDPEGNIVIFRPNRNNLLNGTLNVNSAWVNDLVLSTNWENSPKDKFAIISCGSQENLQYSSLDEDSANVLGIATVDGVRLSRRRNIVAEESMFTEECKLRAEQEANILNMKSKRYICELTGVQSPDGTQWEIGQHINVIDRDVPVSGILLIKSYSMGLTLDGGSRTALTFTQPSSYKTIPQEPLDEKRKLVFIDPSEYIDPEDLFLF